MTDSSSKQSKLGSLRTDIEVAWQQADNKDFAEYNLHGLLAELHLGDNSSFVSHRSENGEG